MARKRKSDRRMPGPGEVEVFSKKITLRNGRVLYAHEVGLECFRFIVKKKR